MSQGKKLTHEEYVELVETKYDGRIKVLGTYTGALNRILVKCNECGNQWEPAAHEVIRKRASYCCRQCMIRDRTITHETYVEMVNEKHNGSITVLDRYVRGSDRIRARCNNDGCGREWTIKAESLIKTNAHGCRACSSKKAATKRRYTQQEFEAKLFEKHGSSIISMSPYTGARKDAKFKHNVDECGFEWWAMADSVINNGCGCPLCGGTMRLTHEQFVEKLHAAHHGDIVALDTYNTLSNKIRFKHVSCGNVWWAPPGNIIYSEQGCPLCASSKGEKMLKSILDDLGIEYEQEFRFNDCRYKKPLPFDFVLFENDKIRLAIEWDGRQHFEPVSWSKKVSAEDEFKQLQIRDIIKIKYCMRNGIPILRIPYYTSREEVIDMLHEILSHKVDYSSQTRRFR